MVKKMETFGFGIFLQCTSKMAMYSAFLDREVFFRVLGEHGT
jgi:hypothetical protein